MTEALRKPAFIFIAVLFIFFSLFRLTESPPTWYDEGLIIQTAINLAKHGEMKLQIAPGAFVSAGHISTGYPVVLPLAAVFKFFGVGLGAARSLMAVFLLIFFAIFYLLSRKLFDGKIALFSIALLASFAPLYGYGKNVLGEVPGLLFLFIALWFLERFEKGGGRKGLLWASLFLGLSVTTKPIFILLIPALILTLIIFGKRVKISISNASFAVFAFLIPVVFWVFWQFGAGDSFSEIWSFYANPYRLENLPAVILTNLVRFITETTPIYTALLLFFWAAALFVKPRKASQIGLVKSFAFIFVVLVLASYLRTPGWYRYFFPAQILGILFFPASIFILASYAADKWKDFSPIFRGLPYAILFFLVLFQFYQVSFDSWVADNYSSRRTAELESYFKSLNSQKSVFIYDAPQLVTFLPHSNYYQYIYADGIWIAGEGELQKVKGRAADFIAVSQEKFEKNKDSFGFYRPKDKVGGYLILERKK